MGAAAGGARAYAQPADSGAHTRMPPSTPSGPKSLNPLAFKHYKADEVIAGKVRAIWCARAVGQRELMGGARTRWEPKGGARTRRGEVG